MNITEIYKLYTKKYLVATDTRKLQKGCIFFCLKGDNFNGNTFAEKALELGASYVVIDEPAYKTHKNILLVENVLNTLQELAKHHRKVLKTIIIGLTGSNGKTTTKELINCVLSKKYNTTATIGNLNNHIGVPLTLLSFTPNTEIGIVEMGANHQKEIAFLCSLCTPDFGYITNFGKAHLEGFGGIEGVIKGKSELYTYIEKYNKKAFINPEDPIQVDKTKKLEVIPFINTIDLINTNPFVSISYNKTTISSNLIGAYNYNNIAAAITIGGYFNVDKNATKEAIENYIPKNNRSQVIVKDNNKIILDAYNANPTSMVAALKSFSNIETSNNNKIIILGDMFELGDTSVLEHQNIADFADSLNFDSIFFVGTNFFSTNTKHQKFKTFTDIENHLITNTLKNNFILIKGSRGMQLERLLDSIN